MHPLLKQVQHFSKEAQLALLLWNHKIVRRQIAELQQHKLCYIEQGHLDAWEHEHAALYHYSAALEMALEELCPAPALPEWMPRAHQE